MTSAYKSSTDLLNHLYPFIVETCNNVLKNEYANDLAHDVYITMSSLDEQYVIDLQANNGLKPYIVRTIVNQARSIKISRKKNYIRREHIELIENSDFIETEQENLLNWHLLTDFEVKFLSHFITCNNILQMSKDYELSRNTVTKYINEIKRKLCG